MGRRVLTMGNLFLTIPFCAGEHHYEITDGALPRDARIIDARMDFAHGRAHDLVLLIESEEWEPNKEGDAYPRHDMTFTTLYSKEEVWSD